MASLETLRTDLYKLFKDPELDLDIKIPLTETIADKLGKYDGRRKKQMDPLIIRNIDKDFNGLATVKYAEAYKTAREKVGGKVKKNIKNMRKTRRVRKTNGRK